MFARSAFRDLQREKILLLCRILKFRVGFPIFPRIPTTFYRAMSDTVFSKIIRREIPADIVYEDDQVLAFRDISPQGPTHILIIPKEPVATANDLTEAHEPLAGHMITVAAAIAKREGIAEKGYRLVMNCNPEGGQEVYHLHLHLIGGRKMTWPPG